MQNKVIAGFQGVLPFLYLGGGLLTILTTHSAMGYPIGLLLVFAALFEWTRQYRSRRQAEEAEVVAVTGMAPLEQPDEWPNLMAIRWRSSFECGHPQIDMQHRELFRIGNELIAAVLDHKPKSEIQWLLQKLIQNIKHHFSTEEEVLGRVRYPGLEEHRRIHRVLLKRATDLEERYQNDMLPVSDLVGFIAYDVVSAHIIQEDLKFRKTA